MATPAAQCPPEKEKLLALSGSDPDSAARYREAVFTPRKSLLDLLDEFPATQLALSTLLELLPPLKPRYYSISSSPRVDGGKCSLTVAVLSGPARSGLGAFEGVCSGYLSRLPPSWTTSRNPSARQSPIVQRHHLGQKHRGEKPFPGAGPPSNRRRGSRGQRR